MNNGKIIYFNENIVKLNEKNKKIIKTTQNQFITEILTIKEKDTHILFVTKNGYGKCLQTEVYRKTSDNKIVIIKKKQNITTNKGIALNEKDNIYIITISGIIKKLNIKTLLKKTENIKLINLEKNDFIKELKKINY